MFYGWKSAFFSIHFLKMEKIFCKKEKFVNFEINEIKLNG